MKNSKEIKSKQIFETILQLGLVFLILGFCFQLLLPFMMPILWAIILAITFYPIFDFLQKKLKGRKSLASFLIIATILALIIIPTVVFFNSVTTTLVELKAGVEDGSLKVAAPGQNIKDWPIIGDKAYNFLYALSTDLEKGLLEYKAQIVEVSKSVLGSIASSIGSLLQVILSVIIAGVLMVSTSAQNLATNFIKRISGDSGEEFLNISVSTVYQVVKGILGVAIIQTLIQAVGLFGCGVPFAGVLTLLCLMLSIIQIGPIIINLGVIAYLFSLDDTTSALLWTVFFIVSGLSDNVLKPLLLGKGAMVPMLVIFLGVIGGFMMSGFIGLFVGPIVFSIGYKLFEAWMDDKPEKTIAE
ncbi:Predicted PurR-regulated permease PerM [Flavobacterium fluvii]|uniref:Predicted PurR-regulated permease PerM n=1 Tax=Flavobacterium fluvii TaxID=468056 RepID=A0A1M5M775_9FLAO|nr:AI-2E family transporter [Flavobacterium fluvii]SHG73131.1 Predicted PurR-regulated permease PerM [Flavobacterium fluvii]